jgi:hypothetical protein
LGHGAVFKRHKHFARGIDSLKDGAHGTVKNGRTELKIQEVTMLVHANRSQMVDEVAEAAAGISHGTCPNNSV